MVSRSLHLLVAVTEGNLAKNLNKIGVRLDRWRTEAHCFERRLNPRGLWRCGYLIGTRRFKSSNQFSTTWISRTAGASRPRINMNRCPSAVTSYERPETFK